MQLDVRFFVSALAFIAAACGSSTASTCGGGGSSMSNMITIADFSFTPVSTTVPVGTTVTWTNNGPSLHTTTSDATGWDSGNLNATQTFSHQFTTAGTFTYHCTLHPPSQYPCFTGTINVQ